MIILMRESKLNYTQEELLELKKLADIKRQYLHMSNEPLFHVDYRVHPTEHINNLQEEGREYIISYFKFGLNILITKINDYGFIKLMEDNKD